MQENRLAQERPDPEPALRQTRKQMIRKYPTRKQEQKLYIYGMAIIQCVCVCVYRKGFPIDWREVEQCVILVDGT